MRDRKITISTVNWYSSNYLDHLFKNLIDKAENKNRLNFVIIDNTNNDDEKIHFISQKYNAHIIRNNPRGLKGSCGHASGLNFLTKQIKTQYVLIVDPDIHVFKDNWDSFLLERIVSQGLTAIGTTYPKWQLGKYHNFPNPVFCLYDSEKFFKLNPDWTPYDENSIIRIWDFIRRNLLRLTVLINRKAYDNSRFIRNYWTKIESFMGVCSKDTGWKIAKNAKRQDTKSVVFDSMMNTNIPKSNVFFEIAKEFELYYLDGEQFMAHKYSTHATTWKTKKGNDNAYWNKCITDISCRE